MEQVKICKACKVEKPISDYRKMQSGKYGVSGTCKTCTNIKNTEYKLANKDKIRASNQAYRKTEYGKAVAKKSRENRAEYIKTYYQINKESILEQKAEYRKLNKDKIRVSQKAHYLKHKEERNEKSKAAYHADKPNYLIRFKKWAENNKDKVNAASRRYKENNPEKRKEVALKYAKKVGSTHKGRVRYFGGEYEKVVTFDVFDRDKWTCQICGVKTPKKLRGTIENNAPELDHIIPLSKKGSHTYNNVQCACRKCNQSKRDKIIGQIPLFGQPLNMNLYESL